eukprot:maker-scaffold1028_size131186-snap-gene-0.56 protein:Tk10633 transcript:maker-scaffold1028_size131186-snap-gene-0.56-mRNA-1 annotation:"PREDICTED: uncharacterized protein LOC593800"
MHPVHAPRPCAPATPIDRPTSGTADPPGDVELRMGDPSPPDVDARPSPRDGELVPPSPPESLSILAASRTPSAAGSSGTLADLSSQSLNLRLDDSLILASTEPTTHEELDLGQSDPSETEPSAPVMGDKRPCSSPPESQETASPRKISQAVTPGSSGVTPGQLDASVTWLEQSQPSLNESVIVLGDSPLPAAVKKSPIKMRPMSVSSDERVRDLDSDPVFMRLTPQTVSTDTETTGGEEAAVPSETGTTLESDSHPPDGTNSSAPGRSRGGDDEASSSGPGDVLTTPNLTADLPHSTINGVAHSDFSVSPIDAQRLKVRTDWVKSARKTTSTPGLPNISPRKRPHPPINPDSSDAADPRPLPSAPKRVQYAQSPSPARPQAEDFKEPSAKSAEVYVTLLGPLTKDEHDDIWRLFKKKVVFHQRLNPDSPWDQLKSLEARMRSPVAHSTTVLKKSRISDVTQISVASLSSSTSASSAGYQADGSSGISSSSGSDARCQRDRLSVMPEMGIVPHNIVAPLPRLSSYPKAGIARPLEKVLDGALAANKLGTGEPRRMAQTPSEEPGGTKLQLYADCHVFAKFVEKTLVNFWPATILSHEIDDVWKVKFTDGVVKDLRTQDLIPATCLARGHEVNVFFDGKDQGNYKSGKLVSFPDQTDGLSFQVEFHDSEDAPAQETRLIAHTKVFLNTDQARYIQRDLGGPWSTPTVSKTGSEISLDNIVDSGRRRTAKVIAMSSPVSTPKSTPRGRKRGGPRIETSAVETETEDSARKSTMKKRNPRRKIFVTTDDETNDETPDSRWPTRRNARKGTPQGEASKPLFKGMKFLLTQGTKSTVSHIDTETDDGSDHDQSGTIVEDSFNKREIRRVLEQNGGTVLKSFPGAHQNVPKELLIISERECKTMSFLLSLAYGFPRINFKWVLDSVREHDPLPIKHYHLPVGVSRLNGLVVEHRQGNLFELFKGQTILLACSNSQLNDDWKPLLNRLGGHVCSKTKGKIDRKLPKLDVVVAEAPSPADLISDAQSKNIPVVNTEWVIQSLIHGSLIDKATFLAEQC